MEQKLTVSLSPHIHTRDSVRRRMWNVVGALLPPLAVALWIFGIPALAVVLVSVASCLLTEWFIDRFMLHRPQTLTDGSALITAILLAFNLPSTLPLWMVAIGGVVAIGIGKMSFGGLGTNIWNPALVGRVFLLLSFPAAMTTWAPDVASGYIDAASGATAHASSGATMLASMKAAGHNVGFDNIDWWQAALGNMNGSLGEVGTIAILIGLAWLLISRTITWHIPVAVLAGAAVTSLAVGANPLAELLAGGMMLGAVYMATDYVTSPMTHRGQIIYGLLIGAITIIIRCYGSYPEGMSFAILLMNSFTPLINIYCKPKRFGERRARA